MARCGGDWLTHDVLEVGDGNVAPDGRDTFGGVQVYLVGLAQRGARIFQETRDTILFPTIGGAPKLKKTATSMLLLARSEFAAYICTSYPIELSIPTCHEKETRGKAETQITH